MIRLKAVANMNTIVADGSDVKRYTQVVWISYIGF